MFDKIALGLGDDNNTLTYCEDDELLNDDYIYATYGEDDTHYLVTKHKSENLYIVIEQAGILLELYDCYYPDEQPTVGMLFEYFKSKEIYDGLIIRSNVRSENEELIAIAHDVYDTHKSYSEKIPFISPRERHPLTRECTKDEAIKASSVYIVRTHDDWLSFLVTKHESKDIYIIATMSIQGDIKVICHIELEQDEPTIEDLEKYFRNYLKIARIKESIWEIWIEEKRAILHKKYKKLDCKDAHEAMLKVLDD